MTCNDIIVQYLKYNGFDGLCGDECCCVIEDLSPFDCCDWKDCEPGYKIPCPGEGKCDYDEYGCDYHMSTKKDNNGKI